MAYKPLNNHMQEKLEDDEGEKLKADPVEEEHDVITKQEPHRAFKIARYIMTIGTFVMLFLFLAAAITLVALAPSCESSTALSWWQTSVIYQCYPRSFKDSSGDGSGDLKGILSKSDYLHSLGVDAVWLNPIFKSPQRDNGYDISNYTDVDTLYGNLSDLKELAHELHSKGMHLILDFVPNHTSDEHPWFVESRSNKSNSKRDWYVWADPSPDGGPPNNWLSVFGGSAWTLDNTTNQYYLHQFSSFQPDLNYWNKDVITAMEDVLKFWFDFGIDGFRIDAVIFLLEDPQLRDEVADPDFNGTATDCATNNSSPDCYNSLIHNLTTNYPGIHNITKGWRRVADSYYDRFLVGETYGPVETVVRYYGTKNDEFHFPFNFLLLSNNNWTGDVVSNRVSDWLDAMPEGAWPNWVLGNHDNPRIANKAGNYLARALNVLLLTLPGTPTTYYGEEIFMTDVYVPPDQRQDKYQDRDKERTPMQWANMSNAGFTKSGVKPWLPVATNYSTYNVEVELLDNSSMLMLYKDVVSLRSTYDALRYMGYSKLLNDTDVFAYLRFHSGSKEEFIVVVNFAPTDTTANLTEIQDQFVGAKIEISSANADRKGSEVNLTDISLAGGEALIISGSGSRKSDHC